MRLLLKSERAASDRVSDGNHPFRLLSEKDDDDWDRGWNGRTRY